MISNNSDIQAVFDNQRSGRERGLVERFARNDVGLDVKFTWVTLPMRKAEDDFTIEMVQWPFLLPHDFAQWYI